MNQSIEIWEKNISAIKERSFNVHLDPPSPCQNNTGRVLCLNGSLTMSFAGKLLHSKVDPEGEGKKFADGVNLKTGDHILLYGFGLAYHVPPVLDSIGPTGQVIVVELNDDILRQALSLKDFSSLLLCSNFFLVGGGSEYSVSKNLHEILENWSQVDEERKRVAIFAPSYQFFPKGYNSIKRAFDVQKMEKRFEAVLGDCAKANYTKNIKYIENSKKTAELYGRYSGCLGLLVGSGPSLDSVIRYLKYLPEKSFLLAVDSSLSVLVENGIKVDAFISVDPQHMVCSYVCGFAKKNTALFFMGNSNHILVKNHPGERYFVSREGIEGPSDAVRAGGAVSCVGLELLIKLGTNPIVQVGIDSSFPGRRYYANQISASEEMFDKITKLKTLQERHRERIDLEQMVDVKNYAGGRTGSHLNLFSYMRTIESLAGMNKGVTIGVPGCSGASIAGVSPLSLPELLYREE